MSRTFFGQIGRLKPEKVAEYRELHLNPWPEILDIIRECNIVNYSIFLHGDTAFSYFEYIGDDYEADMEKMAQCPAMQRWWTYSKPCFVQYAMSPGAQFYCDMERVFYTA